MRFLLARLRHLAPAGAVALVLAISYLSPLNTEASKLNNCGVKAGYADSYGDHGKPCPNRPFPGRGVGLGKFGIDIAAGPADTKKSVGHAKNASVHQGKKASVISATSSPSADNNSQSGAGEDNSSSGIRHCASPEARSTPESYWVQLRVGAAAKALITSPRRGTLSR